MRRLKGGVPRWLKHHGTAEGKRYGAVCRALLARLGPLPLDAMPAVKQWAVTSIELDRLGDDLEGARARRRRRDIARIRRQMVILRSQHMSLGSYLRELANDHRPPAGPLTAADLEALAPAPQNRERP